MKRFQGGMQPFAGLADYAQIIRLPQNKLNIFIYRLGDPRADALILIHGLGDEADTWRAILPALAEHHHVIALDLPGFGRSDKPAVAYSVPFFQNVLLELIEVLDISQPALVGHSLGAVIAQSTALREPGRFSRLALVSGGMVARYQKIDPTILGFMIPGLGEWLYNRLRRDPLAAYQSLAPYYADLAHLPEEQSQFLYQRVNERVWDNQQRRAFLTTVRSLARWAPSQQKYLPERLANFELPTLILWGENDRINSLENGRLLASLQPSAKLTIIPGAGHNLQQEMPDALLAALADWFA